MVGAGSAGLVSSYIAAAAKAKVVLIEKHRMGGDCLNTGCVPSKALIRAAKLAHDLRKAKEFGIRVKDFDIDFAAVMAHVHQAIQNIEPHDSIDRYEKLGVSCVQGEAEILDENTVRVGQREYQGRNLILALGARPRIPPLPGIENITPLTSDNLWDLRALPGQLIVLGGGPIGCELAQAFRRLGSQVAIIESAARLMPREDIDVSRHIEEKFREEGIQLFLGAKAQRIESSVSGKRLVIKTTPSDSVSGMETEIAFDQLLCAVGRMANTESLPLEQLGLCLSPQGTLQTDPYLCANGRGVYACGDLVGPFQFTHMAAHQAYYAVTNALMRPFYRAAVDYRVVPWVTFTDPEVARVGLSENEAQQRGIAFEKTVYGMDDLDRAIADREAYGFVKVLTVPGKDKILGATIVGKIAGEMNTEFVAAMKHGFGLGKILGTIHPYPTYGEANKYAAGLWRRSRVPPRVLQILSWFQKMRR